MIRILHVVSSLGTGSGMMSVIMSYYRTIDKQQIQFDFLSFRDTEENFEDEIKKLGGNVFHCSKPSFSNSFRSEMTKFFNEHMNEYQIMHCHPIHAGAIFAPYAKKYGIQHIISHSHSTKYSANKIGAIRNFLIVSLFGKRATDYIACSKKAMKLFYWKKETDIFLLNNAIDTEKFKFSDEKRKIIRKDLNIKEDEVVIGHIGRFAPEKNHIFLLNVFKEYYKLNNKSKLLLVGDGSLFNEIQKLAIDEQLEENILFVGRKNNVSDYLSAMDFFVLPSLFEGLPIALVEAQVSGIRSFVSKTVTDEVEFTNLLTFVDLDEGYESWARRIANTHYLPTERRQYDVDYGDFDIYQSTKKLENYYIKLLKDN